VRVSRSILLLSAFVLFGVSANAGSIFAAIAGSSNFFGTIDTTTGVFSNIATQPATVFGMGFNGNGTLYGTDDASPSAGVYQIDPGTGALNPLGTVPDTTEGGTVGSDGLIYSVGAGGNANFFTIDPVTLVVHIINDNLGFQSDGLAVFLDGIFYTDILSSDGNDQLEAVDPVTGIATPVGTGLGVFIFSGVNVNGVIYAAGGDGNLYTINTATGIATLDVAITGVIGNVDALAFNSIPEPSTGMLASLGFVLAGAAVAIRSRRRRARRS
jgi:hypothetical protein